MYNFTDGWPSYEADVAIVNGVQVWLIGGTDAARAEVREAVTFALEVLTTAPEGEHRSPGAG